MPAATIANTSYPLARPPRECHVTGRNIEPGHPYVAALKSADETGRLERVAYDPDAFVGLPDADRAALLAHWRTTMPDGSPRPKRLAGDTLVELFRRLGDEEGDERLAFRFVLGLLMMRRRLLSLDRTDADDQGRPVWVVRLRKCDDPEQAEIELVDPKLDPSHLEELGREVARLIEAEGDE